MKNGEKCDEKDVGDGNERVLQNEHSDNLQSVDNNPVNALSTDNNTTKVEVGTTGEKSDENDIGDANKTVLQTEDSDNLQSVDNNPVKSSCTQNNTPSKVEVHTTGEKCDDKQLAEISDKNGTTEDSHISNCMVPKYRATVDYTPRLRASRNLPRCMANSDTYEAVANNYPGLATANSYPGTTST